MVTAHELERERQRKKRVTHDTYKIILRRIQEEIKLNAKVSDVTNLTTPVPPHIINRPLYDPRAAARYVSLCLQRDGFDTKVLYDESGEFYVRASWEPKQRKLKTLERAAADRHSRDVRKRDDEKTQARRVHEAAETAKTVDDIQARLRTLLGKKL